MQRFDKFDDLRRVVKEAPLLPFEGPDALFYLELRELIDEVDEKTFVSTDLRQGLSSYRQLAQSKLLKRDVDSAKRLKRLVDNWNGKTLRLHPKVEALADLVEAIAVAEIDKVGGNPGSWFSKILNPPNSSTTTSVPPTILLKYRGEHLVDPCQARLLRRTEQPIFLLRALSQCGTLASDAIDRWLKSEVIGPFDETIRRIIGSHLHPSANQDRPREELIEMAERECVVLLEECRALEIVGRYDGDTVRDREAHRRNFNQMFNPFVLLVSRLGEEGIDLQHQCRYIVHYDLEWNPAKMEHIGANINCSRSVGTLARIMQRFELRVDSR
jgi:Helicase conserved C-terminal domain